MFIKFLKLSLLAVSVLFLSACSFPWEKKPAPSLNLSLPSEAEDQSLGQDLTISAGTGSLYKFNNYEELSQWLADNHNPAANLSSRSFDSGPSLGEEGAPQNAFDYAALNALSPQEHEADIIRVDAQNGHIYALVKNELLVLRFSTAGALTPISKISFTSRPQGLFLSGNSLVVFGSDLNISAQPLYKTWRRQSPYVFVKVFDVSDPLNPRVSRDLNFEGLYRGARLAGNRLYFFTDFQAAYLSSEPLIPRLLENGRVLGQKCEGGAKCFVPEVYYFDAPYDEYSFLSMTAIDLENYSTPLSGQVYLLDSAQDFYLSSGHAYISYARGLKEDDLERLAKRELVYPLLKVAEQNKITEIEAAPGYLLNVHEKKIKSGLIIDRYLEALSATERSTLDLEIAAVRDQKAATLESGQGKTVIHKLALAGGKLEYRAVGEVPGHLPGSQFFNESGEYLRLLTLRAGGRAPLGASTLSSYNNIYVLDKDLKIVGRLENLVTEDEVHALRFFPGRAYVVGSNPDDPIFALDLSNPQKPSVLNAIRVPGWGNYLHPLDTDGKKLFGLGRLAPEEGGSQAASALRLSVYDFSDPARPRETSSYIIDEDGGNSVALADHRAFFYSPSRKLVALPAALDDGGNLNFSGTLIFELEGEQLNFKSRIDHSAGGFFSQPDYWQGVNYYNNTVRRAVLIGDRLLTFSNKFMKINNLADGSELGSLILSPGSEDSLLTAEAESGTPSQPGAGEEGANPEDALPGAAPEPGSESPPTNGQENNSPAEGEGEDSGATPPAPPASDPVSPEDPGEPTGE